MYHMVYYMKNHPAFIHEQHPCTRVTRLVSRHKYHGSCVCNPRWSRRSLRCTIFAGFLSEDILHIAVLIAEDYILAVLFSKDYILAVLKMYFTYIAVQFSEDWGELCLQSTMKEPAKPAMYRGISMGYGILLASYMVTAVAGDAPLGCLSALEV